MISLRDYAKQNNISYEAVRLSVKRYEPELEGHIIKQGKARYLDDEGAQILDKLRKGTPVIVYQADRAEELEQLRAQNEILKAKIIELQDGIIARDTEYKALQARYVALLEVRSERAEDAAEDAREAPEGAAGDVQEEILQADPEAGAEEILQADPEGRAEEILQADPEGRAEEILEEIQEDLPAEGGNADSDPDTRAAMDAKEAETKKDPSGHQEGLQQARMTFWERVRFVFTGR